MATNVVTVTGPVVVPNGNSMTSGSVKFLLTGWDTDTAADETVYPEPVFASINGSGDFNADLWPNSRGSRGTRYHVSVTGENASGRFETLLGSVSVPEDGVPHELSDLLAAGTPAPGAVYMGIITQDQYDAAIAAAEDAETAQTAAEAAQSAAEAAQAAAEAAADTIDVDKLAGIEAGADVTDTANVTAAGALMDSEVTNLAAVKAFDPSDYQPALSEGAFVDGDKTKLDSIETGATRNLAVDTFSDLASLTASDLDEGDYAQVTETGMVVKRVPSGGDLDYSGSGGVQFDIVLTPSEGLTLGNVSDVLDSTDDWWPENTVVRASAEGAAYRVVTSDEHLTTAGGVKLKVQRRTGAYHLGDFGADTSGTTDAGPLIAKALSAIASDGGGTLKGAPGATYKNNTSHTITTNDVRLDFTGCTLTGSGRFTFDGDSGSDGDRSSAVKRPALIGAHFTGSHLGPIFKWCDTPMLENLSRDNDNGSWINVHYCHGGYAKGCIAEDGDITKIAFLCLHCENFQFIDCHITGGSWVYGFQLKGGRNNWCIDCSIENATFTHGFRDRGDSPWGASTTTGTYPYSTGSWGSADTRRANNMCGFIRCRVTNSTGVPFLGQESIGTIWDEPYCPDASSTCLSITKVSGGSEANYLIRRPNFSGGSGIGIVISGVGTSDLLEGVVIEDPVLSGFTSDSAMSIKYCDSPKIVRPQIEGESGQKCIEFVDITNFDVRGGKATGGTNGVSIAMTTVAPGIGNLHDCDLTGNSVKGYSGTIPANISNCPGAVTYQTTDASAYNALQRIFAPDDTKLKVRIAVGYATSSSAGAFEKMCVVEFAGGSSSILGSAIDGHTDINPDTLGGVSLVASTQLRPTITGKDATTVDWTLLELQCDEIAS